MLTKKLRRSIVFILLLLLVPTVGVCKEKIMWLEVIFPPFLIHEGDFAGLGYGDVGSDILIENLPQYEHEQLIANISRQYKLYEQGENVCTVGLFKNPDREKFMYFSIPVFISLPNHLIIHKSKHELFGGKSSVKLQEVLESNKVIIGHSKNRSYSAEIDEVLKQYGNEKNIFLYESRGELAGSFFEMLKRDRLDAIIGAPEEVLYQAEKLGLRDQLMTIAIEENSLDAWLSYVACAKTEWGSKVIGQVNKILVEHRPSERYRGAYERWLDENRIEEYRKTYDKEFLTITE